MSKTNKKIGLALGSGSARGWAHIGVIEALREAGVEIDFIAGTSIGSVVGAFYASGNLDALKNVILQFDWKQILGFLDVVYPKSGLIDGKKVSNFIRGHVQEKMIEDLSLPFHAVSTNLLNGQEVVLKKGDLIEAVRASISIPGIFTPVSKDGMTLVDGGLVNPVPISVVRAMGADIVIAVDLNPGVLGRRKTNTKIPTVPPDMTCDADSEKTPRSKVVSELNKRAKMFKAAAGVQIRQWLSDSSTPSIFDVLQESIYIMESGITETRLKLYPPDLLIQPQLGHIKFMEFHRADEAIAIGYKEAIGKISKYLKSNMA